MKILLVGEYYSENQGDPLLCQTVESLIREAYPASEIIPFDMCGKIGPDAYYVPEQGPSEAWLWICDHFRTRRVGAICRAYEKERDRYLRVWFLLNELLKEHRFDLVIFAGGEIFMDFFAGIIYMIVKRLSRTNTKILFHACGMGQLDADTEYLLRRALKSRKISSISLRDAYDRFTKLFRVKCPVVKTADTALNCSRLYEGASEMAAELGIGLIDRCRDQQLKLLRYCMETGAHWKAFTNGGSYDYEYAQGLLLEAGVPAGKLTDYLLPRPETPEALVKTVTSFRRVISFRMHSQIVAASFGIPCFGLVWDEKIIELYEKIGFPQGCAGEVADFAEVEDVLSRYSERIHAQALTLAEESRRCLLEAIEQASR